MLPRHLANDLSKLHHFVSFVLAMFFKCIKSFIQCVCIEKDCLAYQELSYPCCIKTHRKLII